MKASVFGAFNYGLHLFGGYLGGRFLSNRNLFVGGMALQVAGCACIALGTVAMLYVGLALFRQVPAGVPGGWRLLANLVSRFLKHSLRIVQLLQRQSLLFADGLALRSIEFNAHLLRESSCLSSNIETRKPAAANRGAAIRSGRSVPVSARHGR